MEGQVSGRSWTGGWGDGLAETSEITGFTSVPRHFG
jgi:hypothetical protein